MLDEPTRLSDAEHEAFVSDLTPIVLNTVHSLVGLADKYNLDRDNVMEYFSTLFSTMAEISTFAGFESGDPPGR